MHLPMDLIVAWALMAPILFLIVFLPDLLTILACAEFWVPFLGFVLISYMLIVRHVRYQRVNMIKTRYGFTDKYDSYKAMTPDESQAVLKNLAEWDFPFLFEFGWISQFFKVRADR